MIRANDADNTLLKLMPKIEEVLEIVKHVEEGDEEESIDHVDTLLIHIEGQTEFFGHKSLKDRFSFKRITVNDTMPEDFKEAEVIKDIKDVNNLWRIFSSKVNSELESAFEIKTTLKIVNLMIAFQMIVFVVLFFIMVIPNCFFNDYGGYRWIFVMFPITVIMCMNFYLQRVIFRFKNIVENLEKLCDEESKIPAYAEEKVSFELGGFVKIEDTIYQLKEEFIGGIYPLSILVRVKFPKEPVEEEVSVSSRARRIQSRLQDLENLKLDKPLTDDEKHQARKKILNDM